MKQEGNFHKYGILHYCMMSKKGQIGKDGKFLEMEQNKEKIFNMSQSHPNLFVTHTPDIKNMNEQDPGV